MMRLKRAAALLLTICMLLCLSACGGLGSGARGEDPDTQNTQQGDPDLSETSDAPDPTDTEDPGEETVLPTPPAVHAGAQALALQKQLYGLYEWADDNLLVHSAFSHVTLWHEDAEKYPELAAALEQTAAMVKRSMEDEYDNLCATARVDLAGAGYGLETSVSTLDIQVRRADSVAISLLSDSYSDYGWIEVFRGMHGTNYDTQTGQELKLSDVIKDMGPIPALVEQELNRHMWAGDFSYDGVVADYFRNTPEDGVSWTLDYNGVTFYFADGDLAEPGNGRQTATVAFAEYPELFVEKYMSVPDAYTVELPLDSSFFTDLDGDGDLEELNITGWYDSAMAMYTECGIYTDTDGFYHYEEYHCDGFHPYYVKTADGNHYLYLFCKQNQDPSPQMNLVVYDVTGGGLTRVGERNMGPACIPVDIIRIPTDPNSLWLDDYDGMAQDAMEYAVGSNGLPERKGES